MSEGKGKNVYVELRVLSILAIWEDFTYVDQNKKSFAKFLREQMIQYQVNVSNDEVNNPINLVSRGINLLQVSMQYKQYILFTNILFYMCTCKM